MSSATANGGVRNSVAGFPEVATGAKTLGWIVAWEFENLRVPYAALRDALSDAGLDPAWARGILPANAFKRAARTLSDNRIIRQLDVAPDGEHMRFQFTAEARGTELINYNVETVMTLNLVTGDVDSDRDDLNQAAKAAFDEAIATRTTSDVTSIIQRMFADKKKASLDLVPLNRRGMYWVRREEGAFLDKVEAFVSGLGGLFTRLPVAATAAPDGTPGPAEKTIKHAAAHKMEGLIEELNEATAAFGADTTERAMTGAAERIKLIRHKILSYQTYLDDEKGKLEKSLAAATLALREKITEIGRMREAAAGQA